MVIAALAEVHEINREKVKHLLTLPLRLCSLLNCLFCQPGCRAPAVLSCYFLFELFGFLLGRGCRLWLRVTYWTKCIQVHNLRAIVCYCKVQYFMHWSWSEGPCQVSIWLTEDQIDHWQGIARPPLSHLPFLSCLSGDTCTMSRSRRGEFHIRPDCLRETRDSQGGRGGARDSWTEREIQGEGWLRQC